MTKQEFLANESKLLAKRSTMTIVSANVGRWIGGLARIPDEIAESARRVLRRGVEKDHIRDFRVYAFGDDLHLQINSLGQGLHHPRIHQLACEAAAATLKAAAESGIYRPVDGQDFFRLGPSERIAALHLRPMEFPFTERGAEPLVVAKLMGGGAGGFNRMLFNLFFHPDKGSHQRLDSARFISIVERVDDLQAGKKERRVYAFGDRPLEERLFLIYPYLQEPLELSREQVGDPGELLTMIANPAEWVSTAIYAARGRFVSDGQNFVSTRHEPVAVVSVEPALPGVPVEDPVVVVRLQGGLPAVGESHANLGADFHFTIGGRGSGYHVGVMPVTIAQARTRNAEPGAAKLAAYAYQSYDQGRIPPDHDVIDLFAQDSVQTEWLQEDAEELIRIMVQHEEFQPYVTAEETEKRSAARARELKTFFEPIPSAETGETDPLIARANKAVQGEAFSDIKADCGGKVGHTSPTTLFEFVARASLIEARENGIVRDFQVFGVGDDMHLLLFHNHGVDANDIHLLAFRTFWRTVWITEIIGYKPYGLAQDLKIGPATKGKRVDDLAEPSQRFMDLLPEYLPVPERAHLEKIRQAWSAWKQGQATVEVKKPFAGNVTGQGPGFAELPLRGTWKVGLLAADKCGPAAFNIPIYQAAKKALSSEGFRSRYGQSLAFEIYDVHNHTRIFLDARAHQTDIETLLGATNLFNVKRLWSLEEVVVRRDEVKDALKDIVLAASTEKLSLITGGEYVGKDDPVLLGMEELVDAMFDYMKTGFYLTQGDERGSHYMMLLPKPLTESVATVRSRGLQVGLRVTLSGQRIVEVHDVYAEPSFREARVRIDRINARLWQAQGSEFTPIGVGARDVEPAYPLMQVLNRITAADSPYGVPVRSFVQDLYHKVSQAG